MIATMLIGDGELKYTMTATESIDIRPIEWWVEDGEVWWHEWKPGHKCCYYRDSSKKNVVEHKLCELGHSTSNYRYRIYINGHPILNQLIKLGSNLSREHLRIVAIKEAYKLWVRLVKELVT